MIINTKKMNIRVYSVVSKKKNCFAFILPTLIACRQFSASPVSFFSFSLLLKKTAGDLRSEKITTTRRNEEVMSGVSAHSTILQQTSALTGGDSADVITDESKVTFPFFPSSSVFDIDVCTELSKVPRQKPKFSFFSDPSEANLHNLVSIISNDSNNITVPNNTPKPLLPMWSSSLTSPQLGKQRLVVDNWISVDSCETVPDEHIYEFVSWLKEVLSYDESTSVLLRQLEENVQFCLRKRYTRGVIARREFNTGDVVLTIPLINMSNFNSLLTTTTTTNISTNLLNKFNIVFNSEILERQSLAARRRRVPSFSTIKKIISVRKSFLFDPVPHPLFVDQVYCALLLACEKAEGRCSPLYPYLRLLNAFDDDFIREIHREVVDPYTYLEYSDHCGRFTHFLRLIYTKWVEDYEILCNTEKSCFSSSYSSLFSYSLLRGETKRSVNEGDFETDRDALDYMNKNKKNNDCSVGYNNNIDNNNNNESFILQPPPSFEDICWAFRTVLSRQRILPLRQNTNDFEAICTEENTWQEKQGDIFAWLINKTKWGIFDKLLGVVDHSHTCINDFNPNAIASLVPVLDMIQPPFGGVANTKLSVENFPHSTHDEKKSTELRNKENNLFYAVIRASTNIEEGDEITLLFPKCYSVSYTLYRYGFLPLRRREDDIASTFFDAQKK